MKDRLKKEELKPVKSIFLAAYLATKDISPVKIVPGNGREVVFLYENTPEVIFLEQEFFTSIDLQTFLNTYRILKAKIAKIRNKENGIHDYQNQT